MHVHAQVWVYGNSFESYVVAIVVPDMEVLKKFLTAEHPGKSIEEAVQVCEVYELCRCVTQRDREVVDESSKRRGQCDVQGACASLCLFFGNDVSLCLVSVQRFSESGCMRVSRFLQ